MHLLVGDFFVCIKHCISFALVSRYFPLEGLVSWKTMGIHTLAQAVTAAIHCDCHLKLLLLEFWQATTLMVKAGYTAFASCLHSG